MDNDYKQVVVVPASANLTPSNTFKPYGMEPEEYRPFQNYWRILVKGKWWMLGAFISMVALAGLICLFMKPLYRSTITLQIIQDNPSALLGERDPLSLLTGADSASATKFYETQFKILDSRPMVLRLIKALNLEDHPEFKKLAARYSDKSPQEIEDKYIKFFNKNLQIKPLRKTYLVDISYMSSDKQLAQEVPNALYRQYIKFSMETRGQSYAMIKEWLESELQKFATKVEESERKLYEHGQQKDFLSLEGKDNVIVTKYVELSAMLTKAQASRTQKEAQYKQIKTKGLDAPLIINNLLVQKLREEAISQEAKVQSMGKIYDINYPPFRVEQAKLKETNSRLNKELQRLKASVESDYEASLKTENLLQEALESQKNNVSNLQTNLVQHHILLRDMKTNEQLYQALLARMKETSVTSTMVTSNVAVIAPAELPIKPYRPDPLLYLSLGAGLGLIFGVGLAFVKNYLDNTITTTEEMQRISRIPLLGIVPHMSLERQGNREGLKGIEKIEPALVTLNHPGSLVTEAIYNLRTAVMFSLPGGPPGTILVTSANANEGKTTISVNLAASLAMNGSRVLLIDADLRKPSIHKIMGYPAQPGLSDFLAGYANRTDILRSTSNPNLFIITAGTIPPQPIELLASNGFKDLLSGFRKEFEHLIIDAPPILGLADGRIISSTVDGVLLVAKHHSTRKDSLRFTVQFLNQVHAPLLGGVLTMVLRDVGEGGYYNYKYYYKEKADITPNTLIEP
jgi:polysaccharide biosynthesis transport protein